MESENVAVLFEQNSIAQIEEIENKLLKEIEKKKDDIKQIIGEKYKDLIDVSDGLNVMAQRCLIVVDEIDYLNASFNNFKSRFNQSITKQRLPDSPVNKGNLGQWTLAVKCKIVIKAPSKIWYYLDSNDILSATHHYFHVSHIYDKLKESFADMGLNRATIVTEYAKMISNFSNILVNQGVKNIYYNHTSIPQPEFITLNLTCISILQSLNPLELLKMFLETRFQQLVELFESTTPNIESTFKILFGNIFDTCRSAYLVFVEDMGFSFYLTRTRDLVENFQASHDLICDQQYLLLVPSDILHFRLKVPFNDIELSKTQVKGMCNDWIYRVNQVIIPRFSLLLNQVDSMRDLVRSLNGVNRLMEESSIMLNWNDLNGILFDNEIDIWKFFLRETIMSVMKKLIITFIRNAYDSLQSAIVSRSKSSDEVADETPIDVVWLKDTVDQETLAPKAFALLEQNTKICVDFEKHWESISDQMSIIKDNASQAIIPMKDLVTLQEVFSTALLDNLNVLLLLSEDSSISKENADSLFVANIYRTLVFGCPQFKNCHYLFSKDPKSWNGSRTVLQKTYNQLFIKFISDRFGTLMDEFTSEMDISVISKFLDLCLNWEEIELEETLEDGKSIKSTIRIPMYVSIPLYNLLKQLNLAINNIGAHTISRTTIFTVLGEIGSKLTSFYQKLLQEIITKETPKNVKHTQILQLYFDITFFDQLIGLIKDESVKEIKLLLEECISNYQSRIDPFDLHVLQPYLTSSVSRCLRNNALLFGHLIGQSTISSSVPPSISTQSKTNPKTDPPNPMPSYSLNFQFPLLQKSKNK